MKKGFTLAEVFSPLFDSRGKNAFTLAEVLITLGIIGVVAALTMPSLIQKYQKQTTVTRLKKAYSEISQALKLAEVEYGSMDNWNYTSLPESHGFQEIYWVENYFLPYIKTAKVCLTKENLSKCGTDGKLRNLNGSVVQSPYAHTAYVITASGYGIQFMAGGKSNNNKESEYSPHMHLYVDIDGPKRGKGIYGKDIFLMTANFGKQAGVISSNHEKSEKNSGLVMFGNGWKPALTRDDLKSNNYYGCSKNAAVYQAGRFCGAMIQNDGWQIAPDYPW